VTNEVRGAASKALEYLKRIAKGHPDIDAQVAELERDVAQAESALSAMDLKKAYFAQSQPVEPDIGRPVAGRPVAVELGGLRLRQHVEAEPAGWMTGRRRTDRGSWSGTCRSPCSDPARLNLVSIPRYITAALVRWFSAFGRSPVQR
jgi:hypothetical protein